MNIVAQKFSFFIITPEGESGGWTFNKIDARGNLHLRVDANSLATHKNGAGNQLSGYPPLTAKAAGIIQLEDDIAKGQQRLQELNIGIPILQGVAALAKINNDNTQRDTKATNGDKFLAAAALIAADFAVDQAIAGRNTVQYNLSSNRKRLSDLQAQPD